ncbi:MULTISPECIES: hypothetical protein [unclassified Microcoleus]|uniref:hypothetical protein n=1 Tax=unclassified Microcoleus TaxID=2642155 RepID=UPI0025D7FB9F|nr:MULTISPECIES: hypothetical protein [unclassified Microcoleus]
MTVEGAECGIKSDSARVKKGEYGGGTVRSRSANNPRSSKNGTSPSGKSAIARSTQQSAPFSKRTQTYKIKIDWRT